MNNGPRESLDWFSDWSGEGGAGLGAGAGAGAGAGLGAGALAGVGAPRERRGLGVITSQEGMSETMPLWRVRSHYFLPMS